MNVKQHCYAPPHTVTVAPGVEIEVTCTRDVRSHKTGHLSRVPLGDHAEMLVRWAGEGVRYANAG